MKKLTIDRNSWHHRLARFGGLSTDYDEERTDLCRYFWALVRGVLRVPFFILVGTLIGAILLAPLLALVVMAIEGRFPPADIFTIFGITLYSVVGMVSVVIWFQEGGGEKIASTHPIALLKAGYRGWKEKTCVLVELR